MFSLSLRYSIYKVQTQFVFAVAFASAANFYMLAHLVEFVKNFFKFLRNSFVLLLRSGVFAFITQLFNVTTQTSFCQEVFSCFLKFFVLSCRPRGQLGYISTVPAFCQALFHKIKCLILVVFTDGHPFFCVRTHLVSAG